MHVKVTSTMARFDWVSSLCAVLFFNFGFVFSSNIPEYIHICHRSDPQVAGCVRNSIEALRPRLIKGIPELNVPGIDPFTLKKIVIFDKAQTPDIESYLEDVVVTGAGNFQITKLKLDVDKMTYRAGIKIPTLSMSGHYSIDAKMFGNRIKSDGKFHGNATGIDGQLLVQALVDDAKKIRFPSMAFKIQIEDFNLDLENLLGNDPVLSQAARQLLSGNKQDLIRLARPHIERKTSEIATELANRITENLNYDEVFPV